MSAATIAHPAALAPRSLERPGLARLTAVELRKMADTRVPASGCNWRSYCSRWPSSRSTACAARSALRA